MSHTALALMFGRPATPGAYEEPLWPSHMLKEIMIWLGMLMLLMTLSWYAPFGVGEGYDLTAASDPPSGVHPEWYFLALFQLLSFVPEVIAMVLAFAVIAFLFAIPKLDPDDTVARKRWISLIAGLILALYAGLALVAYFSMDSSDEKSSSIPVPEERSSVMRTNSRYHHYYTQDYAHQDLHTL